MSGVSFPVHRPPGRALIVGSSTNRPEVVALLQRMQYTCVEVEDPYAAAVELCRKPLAYRGVVLSLASVYMPELALVAMIKRHFGHIEVWLTHIDGRQSLLAEAMRLGADGFVGSDGLHRTTAGASATSEAPVRRPAPAPAEQAPAPVEPDSLESLGGEPVLTAEELRALLQEQPEPREH